MSDDRSKPTGSAALRYALELVSEIDQRGWMYAPVQPTSRMVRIGAAVGGVSPQMAGRIYTAMLKML
jgi:hypothetical protein